MGLADDLASYKPMYPKCTVLKILEELSTEDAEALEKAMANEGLPASHIAKAMSANGYPVGSDTIRRHRRQACACARSNR